MSYPASDVMDRAAALLNDAARDVYTYEVQISYLKMALTELEQEFELNNIPVTNVTSAGIVVDAGDTEITRTNVGSPPNYPENLVEIQGMFERLSGSNDSYLEMTRKEFMPHTDLVLPYFGVYCWKEEVITVPESSTDREIKLDYIKSLFSEVENENSLIFVTNSINFLAYRTAALCASFVGENPTRSAELNGSALIARDQVVGIGTKGRQAITTRRRPFMASYRGRRIG